MSQKKFPDHSSNSLTFPGLRNSDNSRFSRFVGTLIDNSKIKALACVSVQMLIKYLQRLPRNRGSVDGIVTVKTGTHMNWYLKSVPGSVGHGKGILACLTVECCYIPGNTMLNDDAFRTGVAVTPLCSCNVEKETVKHFLFDSTIYREARSQLSDIVNDIWMCVSSEVLFRVKNIRYLPHSVKILLQSQRITL